MKSSKSLFKFFMYYLYETQNGEENSLLCAHKKDLFFSFFSFYSSTNGKISATKARVTTLTLLFSTSSFQVPMGKSLRGYSTFSLLSTLWYNFTYYIVVVVVLVVNENLSHFFWYCQKRKASLEYKLILIYLSKPSKPNKIHLKFNRNENS